MDATDVIIFVISSLKEKKSLIPLNLDAQLLFITDVAVPSFQQLKSKENQTI